MQEDTVGSSPRTYLQNSITNNIINNFNSDGTVKKNINIPFIRVAINFYGNSCNLECYECSPVNSSSRMRVMSELKSDLDDDKIYSDDFSLRDLLTPYNIKNIDQTNSIIENILKYADIISSIEIVGGEPMLMKSHFNLLDRLIEADKAKHIKLDYISNMTLMKINKMEKYFKNFKYTNIQWSVDALNERNHWLRYPTDWDSTIKNVLEIQRYFTKYKCGTIVGKITPSLLGIVSLKETYNWLKRRFLLESKLLIYSAIIDPKFLRTRNLPDELKEKIGNDVKIISEDFYNDMMQPRDENHFQLAIKYFDLLDKKRGTDWRSTFPEIAKYAN